MTDPEKKVVKRYHVRLADQITPVTVDAFAQGMYFEFENITTRPAILKIINDYEAEVSLTEGRYHQIKRMFGRFQNEVLALHRLAIGNLELDPTLAAGESRELTSSEITGIKHPS